MKNYIIKPLLSRPGIQRDGTQFASQSYIDGQWCRFYMGVPRKIGGYKLIDGGTNQIIRSLFGVGKPNDSIDLYLGRASYLKYNHFDFNGNATGEIDRTPSGYDGNLDNVWKFDLFSNSSILDDAGLTYIAGSAIPNGNSVSNEVNGNVYFGSVNDNLPLQQIFNSDFTPLQVSGGIVYTPPFLVAYGNNGVLRWSGGGESISHWPLNHNITISNNKIIQAYRTLGSTPQLLVWTTNSLLTVSYSTITDPATFLASTIQDNITVISPNSIVQFNQEFFWIGIDQFYVFSGIVQRLDNNMSTDWFFQNVNLAQRAKIWGMVIPRYKEIWWFYPRNSRPGINDATECNAVIIYNTELKVWYDSFIGRAAGLSPSIFPLPIMTDSQKSSVSSGRGNANNYGVWMHEFGFDMVIGNKSLAIESYFETKILTLFEGNPENNRLIRNRRIEPDFSQTGNMSVTVNNRMFPSDTLENGRLLQTGPVLFDRNTDKVDDVTSQGRLVSFIFGSNEAGGAYQMGQPLLDYEIGDVRP